VIGDPVLLACAVASMVRHGGHARGAYADPLVVVTERLPSVVHGEFVTRIRVAVDGHATSGRAAREVRASGGSELALAARIAGDHGGVVLGTDEPGAVLDLPSVAA
jgi:hypothetical protein